MFPILRASIKASSTNELFHPMTVWYPTLEAKSTIRGVFNLSVKSGNFQCRIGVQTAPTTLDDIDPAVNPDTHRTQIATAPNRTLLSWDPNGSLDGNIGVATFFRLGVMYSLSAVGIPARGDVQIISLSWR